MAGRLERKKYLRMTLLIIIIPLVFGAMLIAASVVNSIENRSILEDELKNHALLQNRLLADNIERTIDSLNTAALLLQNQYDHTDLLDDQQEFQVILRRYALIEPAVRAAYLLDKHGAMEFTTQRRLSVDESIGQRIAGFHTRQLLQHQMYFDTESQRFFISSAVSEQDHDALRVLVFEVDTSRLFHGIENIETSHMLSGVIADASGTVISTWKKPETLADSKLLSDSLEHLDLYLKELPLRSSEARHAGGTQLSDHGALMTAATHFSVYPYSLYIAYNRQAYFSVWNKSFQRNLLLLSIFFVMSVGGSIGLRKVVINTYKQRQQILNNLEALVAKRTSALQEKSDHLEEMIAAYRETLAELQKSEAYLEAMIDASPAGIISMDTSGHVKSWNKAAEHIFGWREDEVLGASEPFIPRDQSEVYAEYRNRSFKGESFSGIELSSLRRDSTLIQVSLSTAPICNADGHIISLLALYADISEQKLAEQAIEHQAQVFMNLFNSFPDAIAVLDRDDKVIQLNSAFTELFQFATEEAVGEQINNLIVPENQYAQAQELTEQVKSLQIVRLEAVRCRKDGKQIPVSIIGYPNVISGKQIGKFGIYHDLTDQKRTESQLVQSQKMETVGRLAGGVAHDFNNMLGVILGYTEMMLDQLPSDHQFTAELTEVHTAARRSADLTRQLLAFARQQTIYPKLLNLNEVVADMLNMLKRMIGEDITLVWIPDDGIGKVMMDPSQMDQLMINMCVNAREAIADIGTISIETAAVEIDQKYGDEHFASDSGSFVLLTVTDDGCGMDQETLSHIFEPFFTTKMTGEGTGLGMATVFGIVRQNHGFVNVYSEPGFGTTIKVYFPESDDQTIAPQQRNGEETSPAEGSETVLLVDDDSMVKNMTERMLQSMGYTVFSASAPTEAVELVQNHESFDLLITDVIMPEMNGRDLYSKLQALIPDLSCLFMSGYTSNVVVHRGVVDEGVHFIQKPFNKRLLSRKVREALEKDKQQSADEQ